MTYKFTLTPLLVHHLQTIERIKESVRLTVLPFASAEILRIKANIRSTHYSTAIEGNRLTLKETEQVVQQKRRFPGRERDVLEVERYYQALQQMEKWVEEGQTITEERVRKLHAILLNGRGVKPTPYRDGQNVIRESSGGIVYMPPEAKDVPGLMRKMFTWIKQNQKELPIPVIAGITHYQFETIHPFFDGNGRTGRMLTTWILFQGNYDLGKFYALEEFYARDLQSYYKALVTHPHHNYYFGRHEADITPWLEYFLKGMANIFTQVSEQLNSEILKQELDQNTSALLRSLDHRARRVLSLFSTRKYIRSSDVANLLGLSQRQSRDLLAGWVKEGWLETADTSKRGRKYRLAEAYKILLR